MKQNLRFGLILGRPAILKMSAIILKYPTKSEKTVHVCFKEYFFVTKLAKIPQSIVVCGNRDSSPRDLYIKTLEVSQNQLTFLSSII